MQPEQRKWGSHSGISQLTRKRERGKKRLPTPLNSVLVDSKDTDTMQLGQLGDQDAHQRDGVDDEMYPVIFCVETGKKITEKESKGISVLQKCLKYFKTFVSCPTQLDDTKGEKMPGSAI